MDGSTRIRDTDGSTNVRKQLVFVPIAGPMTYDPENSSFCILVYFCADYGIDRSPADLHLRKVADNGNATRGCFPSDDGLMTAHLVLAG